MTPAGNMTSDAIYRPVLVARCAVTATVLLLPRGSLRSRYRQEYLAELHFIDTHTQARFSAGILSRAWALRRALTEEGTMLNDTLPRTPLFCRLNLRHQYRMTATEDGARYRRCRRCGKDDPRTGSGHWASPIPM